jgi:hypothetical protein
MATTPVDILLRVRDEASQKLREVAAETGGLVGTIQRLSAGLGVWGAISVGVTTLGAAAVASAKQMSDLVEQLDRASAITSIGIEPLQAMFKIIKDAGGDTEPLIKGLARFKREVADGNPILKELGVTGGTVVQRFLQVADALGRSSDEYKVAAAAQALFGKTGLQLIPDLANLAANTDKVQQSMKQTHEILEESALPSIRALHEETKKLGGDWKGTWNDIAVALVGPAAIITKLIDGIVGAVHSLGRALFDLTFGAKDALGDVMQKMQRFGPGQPFGARTIPNKPAVSPTSVDSLANLDFAKKERQPKKPTILGPGNDETIHKFIEQQFRDAAEQRKADAAEFLKRNFIIPSAFGGGVLPLPGGPGRLVGSKPPEDPFKKLLDDWKKAADGITNSIAVLNSALDSVYTGLREGFSQAFVGILNSSQTLSQALRTVFTSLAQSILSTLGELVAADVFKLFLKLVGFALGGPAGVAASIVPFGGGPVGAPGAPLLAPAGLPQFAAAPMAGGAAARGGNTYIIQSFSPASVLQSLVSPTGPLRTAYDRLSEVAAAS